MQRKPGGYRKPTEEQRQLSKIPKELFSRVVPANLDSDRRIYEETSGAVSAGASAASRADVFIRR